MSKESQRQTNQESPSQPQISELYRSWGIFNFWQETLDQLPPHWLHILNIARNLYLGKNIPGIYSSSPNNLLSLTKTQTKARYEKRLVTQTTMVPASEPTNEIDVARIKRLTDLEMVIPADAALSAINPDLFAFKAATRSLRIFEHQKPRIVMKPESKTVEEVEMVLEKGTSLRQSVYVLLDVSKSMAYNYKLIFAKAVVLAYLAKAAEEEASLYFRAFAGGVSKLQNPSGSPAGLPALAAYVLDFPTYYYTDVRQALSQVIDDLEERWYKYSGPIKTEILLISDCASYTEIPMIPRSISLHTLHLEGGHEDEDDYHIVYQKRTAEIRAASKTYTKINTADLRLPSETKDAWLLHQELHDLEKDLSRNLPGKPMDEKSKERLERLRQMAKAYRKIYDESDPVKAIQKRLDQIKKEAALTQIKERFKRIKAHLASRVGRQETGRIRGRLQKMKAASSRPSRQGLGFDFRRKPKE